MRLASQSDPALVEAILASFRDPSERTARRLSSFKLRDWKRTEFWLDTSGLALYFLDHLHSHGMESAIDPGIRESLEHKLANNKRRMADMLEEFVAINKLFQEAGAKYANLKGFTLYPDSCPDLSLRHQSDYDFLVDPGHMGLCRTLLEKRGYLLTASTSITFEFKYTGPQTSVFDNRYRPPTRRSVELHASMEGKRTPGTEIQRGARLDRLMPWTCEAGTFPALCSFDQLIGQALHILSHLRNEYTRPSWLLEFRRHVIARQGDEKFWQQIGTPGNVHPDAEIALGLSVTLAAELFGPFPEAEFYEWAAGSLPRSVQMWATLYGRKAMLADTPGTKLYLLLEDALNLRSGQTSSNRIRRLLPLNLPARALRAPAQDTLRLRLRREIFQIHFVLYRFRFHLRQGRRYMLEARRWKKFMRQSGQPLASSSHADSLPSPPWQEASSDSAKLR